MVSNLSHACFVSLQTESDHNHVRSECNNGAGNTRRDGKAERSWLARCDVWVSSIIKHDALA
jgi:hypothetical protein